MMEKDMKNKKILVKLRNQNLDCLYFGFSTKIWTLR